MVGPPAIEPRVLFRRIMSGNYFKENTMGILDRLSPSAQFIEVIEWLDDSSDTMLYRFPVRDQEIKNGAQLIVRESQAAVFVHEGQIAIRARSEEHTSELQSRSDLVCRLLLEKKKKKEIKKLYKQKINTSECRIKQLRQLQNGKLIQSKK